MALTPLQKYAITNVAVCLEDQIFLDSFHYNKTDLRIEWNVRGNQTFDSREIEWLLRCMKECEKILGDASILQRAEEAIREDAQNEYVYDMQMTDDGEEACLARKKAYLATYGLE